MQSNCIRGFGRVGTNHRVTTRRMRLAEVELYGCSEKCPHYVSDKKQDYPTCKLSKKEMNPYTEYDEFRFPLWCLL